MYTVIMEPPAHELLPAERQQCAVRGTMCATTQSTWLLIREVSLQKQSSYFDCLVVTIAALCLDMQDRGNTIRMWRTILSILHKLSIPVVPYINQFV